jgi:hypothetical protein
MEKPFIIDVHIQLREKKILAMHDVQCETEKL